MPTKRKSEKDLVERESAASSEDDASCSSHSEKEEELDPEDREIVNVDFDFFDPKEIDFHSIKRLLQQVFGPDSEECHLSELAELIISQPSVGSCVKTDDDENSDPYAFITALSVEEHKDKKCIISILDYLKKKSNRFPDIHEKFVKLLDSSRIGIVLGDRLINMPVQISVPLYKMLLEEVTWAIEDGKPFQFDYVIFISKTYKEVEPTVKNEKGKKKKKAKTKSLNDTVFYFNQEDEFLEQFSEFHFDYHFSRSDRCADSNRVFQDAGISPSRRMFFVPSTKLADFVTTLEKAIPDLTAH